MYVVGSIEKQCYQGHCIMFNVIWMTIYDSMSNKKHSQ
jgi:hypothetical protein